MAIRESQVVTGEVSFIEALNQLQTALIMLNAGGRLEQLGIRLRKAELKLETVQKQEASGEVKVSVVTVAGAAARESTNTVEATLRPPKPGPVTKAALKATPSQELVSLANALFDVVGEAMTSNPPLELEIGKITVQLVIDRSGEIKVGAPALWKTLLGSLGFDMSLAVGASSVSTSSITLAFASNAVQDENAK